MEWGYEISERSVPNASQPAKSSLEEIACEASLGVRATQASRYVVSNLVRYRVAGIPDRHRRQVFEMLPKQDNLPSAITLLDYGRSPRETHWIMEGYYGASATD